MLNLQTLTKEERQEIAKTIDFIIGYIGIPICKEEGMPDPVEVQIGDVLWKSWDSKSKAAIAKSADILRAIEGDITKEEIDLILSTISQELGPGMEAMTQEQIGQLVGTAYLMGRKDFSKTLGFSPIIQLVDEQAKKWLDNNTVFWIRNYYDDQLGGKIAEAVNTLAVEKGLGRAEVGQMLEQHLGPFFNESKTYWKGLAATTVERARNFGGVQSMVDAEVLAYEILAVMDERTSPICQEMNGKVFYVEQAVKLRDAVMAAKNPEDIKKIHPWPKVDDVKGLSTDKLAAKGLSLPPYHFFCRTTYVVSEFTQPQGPEAPKLDIGFTPTPEPEPVPETSNLINLGSAKELGGAGEKYFYQMKNRPGEKFIFKPAITKKGEGALFKAEVQQAASNIGAKLYEPGDFIRVDKVVNEVGQVGTFQKFIPDITGDLKAINWNELTGEQLKRIQAEQVLDWSMANYDSHGGNFVVTNSGKVFGADKEQAFRYWKDPGAQKISLDYHPNVKYNEQEPIYNQIYRAYKNKHIDLDLQTIMPALKRLEEIPDDVYREMLGEYAKEAWGDEADAFLDWAVKRKQATREEFRSFYTQLLKARDPKFKGKFLFLDEMQPADFAGAPLGAKNLSYFELSKMQSKGLKDLAKVKGVKYFQQMTKEELIEALADPDKTEILSMQAKERVRAKLKTKVPRPAIQEAAATSEINDIFANFDLTPRTPFGAVYKKDGRQIEGQQMTIRRLEESGNPGYQVTLKMTKDFHQAIQDAMQKAGAETRNYKCFVGEIDNQKGIYKLGGTIGHNTDAKCLILKDGNITAIFINDQEKAAFTGQFEIKVFAADGQKAADSIRGFMKKLKLDSLLNDPTPEDEKILRLSRLAWQNAPQQEFNLGVKDRTVVALEKILKDQGIDPQRAAKFVEKEVWPGYKTFVEPGVSAQYKELGAKYLYAGVGDDPEKVINVLGKDSPGMMSTMQRLQNGVFRQGASPDSDIKSGGADSAFVRLATNKATEDGRKFSSSYKGSGYRLIFDISELERTDWYAYSEDTFGRTVGSDFSNRPSAKTFITYQNRYFNTSNEIMFRKGIKKDSVIGVYCDTTQQKNNLLSLFADQGIKDINGIPVDKFVKVKGTM